MPRVSCSSAAAAASTSRLRSGFNFAAARIFVFSLSLRQGSCGGCGFFFVSSRLCELFDHTNGMFFFLMAASVMVLR
jgi:hypothetical protein